jgi:superfamily II DNA or RNA helicase
MKTKLTSNGYYISISLIDEKLLEKIINELTVSPCIKNEYGKKPETFKIYTKTNEYYIVPRVWGIQNFGNPNIIDFKKPISINITFNGELRSYQKIIVKKILHRFNKSQYKPTDLFKNILNFKHNNEILNDLKLSFNNQYGCGIVCIPPGGGKTVIATNIITVLKVKTLIVVHKTFLMDQWIERLRQYIDNVSIGIIRQNKFDVKNRDVVILMAQTGFIHEFLDEELEELKKFSFLVIDEVHHYAAKVFSQILSKFQTPYILGLSATPEREDSLEKVFYWHIGDIIHRSFANNDTIPNIYIKYFKSDNEKFKIEINRYTKQINMAKMLTNLTEIDDRNKFIFEIIKEILEKEPDRKIFLLTNRREHISVMNKLLKDYNVGQYIGGMKKDSLKESEDKNIILGTYEMASEGLDIPDLDTLILATPKSNIIQSVGRILRKEKHMYNYNPMVIDIVDKLSVYYGMYKKRLQIYHTNKYNVITFNNDLIEIKTDNNKSQFIDD